MARVRLVLRRAVRVGVPGVGDGLRLLAVAATAVALRALPVTDPQREPPSRNAVRMLAFVAFVTLTIHCLAVTFQQIQNKSNGPSGQIDYVGALYLGVMRLTSVGYGDVLPIADDEHRIFACVVMFSGVAMIASVTAFATSVLTTTDALQAAIKERKLMLASMMEYYRIPWEVEMEITALLPTALNAENEHKFTQLVSHMPAFMVERIEGYTRAKALSTSIPLFVELPVSIVLELTAHLHQRFYQANECIIEIGDEGREMFFIVTGTAEVVVPLCDEEVIVAVLRGGSFFGEVALVQDVRRTASVIAVTLCELLVLSKVNFTDLVTRHVELRDIFQKEVFSRHNITNLVKHEMNIARQDSSADDFTAVVDLPDTNDLRSDVNPLAPP